MKDAEPTTNNQQPTANIIWLVGLPGSGKTTLGKQLARVLDYDFVDTDELLEERFGATVAQLFAIRGEVFFRKEENKLIGELTQRKTLVVATGGGAACFHNSIQLMNASGVTIYLKTEKPELANRLHRAKQKRPLVQDKTMSEIVEYIENTLAVREPFYLQAQIITGSASAELVAKAIAGAH